MQTEIKKQFHQTNEQFMQLFSSFSVSQINTVPFKGSWTPAQVTVHILKSEIGMVKVLKEAGKKTSRQQDARVPELKNIFLDFSTRLKSPAFILPEEKVYDKNELTGQFRNIMLQLTEAIENADGEEVIADPALGELTKEEIVHFLVYHTQRHIHQLQHIFETLHNKTKAMNATKEFIVRKVNEAFSKNNMAGFLSYCTDDIYWNMVGSSAMHGKEAILKMMEAMPGECPDIAIDTVFSEDDKTACTGTFSMKNKAGIAIKYSFCDIYYFKENQIRALDSYVVEMRS